MKRILSIIFALVLMGSLGHTKAQTTVEYIAPTVTSTEGYDFFVAFLPNGERFAGTKDLKLQLLISSRPVAGHPEITENIVGITYADGTSNEVRVPVGQTQAVDVDAKKAYWEKADDVETALNKGVHVYSKNGVKMTVFATNQIGTDVATYSLDGSHILPKQALGHEYIVECNSHDKMSTEFVIMSTKPKTIVTINLPAGIKTSTGKTIIKNVKLNNPYQIYIVRSQLGGDPKDGENPNIDLSGTTICSNEPIAVWGGNQQAYVPANIPGSEDHTYDQLLPIDRWGKRFIVPMIGQHMRTLQVDIIARENGTQVQLTSKKGTETRSLNQAEKWKRVSKAPFSGSLEDSTLVIEANAPIQVYLYTSVAVANTYEGDDGFDAYQGDPSMTMIAPIEYAMDSLIFSTYTNVTLSQELLVWAKSSTVSSLELDGAPITSSFETLPGGAPFTDYRYARIPVPAGTHTLTAKEKGFGGYIDGLEEGQASLFPIGYEFLPQEDSLFLADENQDIQVIRSEYNKKFPDNGGWYLNREVLPEKIVLDSIFVCDSTTLRFPMIVHNEWDTIIWSVERVNPKNQKRTAYTGDIDEEDPTKTIRKTGMLPDPYLETMLAVQTENNKEATARTKFEDFEIRAVLYRRPKLCGGDDIRYWQQDTINTIVRVYRQYNDTTWMMKCTTDKAFQFFSDLGDDGVTMMPTTFYCVPNSVPEDADPKWNKQLELGENIFVNGQNGELKPYESFNGCDSISVLKVYLCQAYSDTIRKNNFCEADLPALQTELGRFFTENNPIDFAETLKQSKKGESNIWRSESGGTWRFRTNPQKSTLKATGCDDEWEVYQKEAANYLNDSRGTSVKKFKRCDSVLVLEMHVIPMTVIDDYGKQTYCGPTYAWKDANGNLLENIPQNNIGEEKEYTHDIYYDSPAEWVGCIRERHILKLAFITPSEIFEEKIEICEDAGEQTYQRTDAVGDHTWKFDPTGKAGQTIQGEVINYSNSDGCNYQFRYVFKVNPVPVTRDTIVYCSEEGVAQITHEWDGHSSFWWNLKNDSQKTQSESLTIDYPDPPTDGGADTRLIYELADTLETDKGCHDIYYRVLVIMPQYSTKEEHGSITTEDYFSWAGITWAGENTTISGTDVIKLLPEGGTYPAEWTVEYDPTTCRYTMTKTGSTKPIATYICDSTFSMSVQIGRIFRDTTYTYTCDNGDFNWIDQNGDLHNVDITIPAVTRPTVFTFYDSLKTTHPVPDLDSIWVLKLTVYPSYTKPYADETCQSLDGYKWAGHMGEGHDIWIDNNPMIGDSIPTSEYGVYEIVDKLLTQPVTYTNPKTGETFEVRCDSSEVLTLTIHPSYTADLNVVSFERNVASNDTIGFFEDPRKLYYGADYDFKAHNTSLAELQAKYGANNVVEVSLPTGVDVDTLHFKQELHTAQGCDSITFLDLRLVRTFITEYDTVHLGDNVEGYTFGYVDEFGNPVNPGNYKTGDYFRYYYDEYGNIVCDADGNPVEVQYDDPDKPKVVREFHFEDTIQTASGADSIIRQTVYIYPTYRILDKADTTCYNDPYDWDVYDPETRTTHHWEDLNKLTTDPLTMTVEFDDTLHVMQYRSVGKFDSIRVLQLMILPGRTVFDKDSFCKNETYVWRGHTIEYPTYRVMDSVEIPGFERCKTKFQFDIKWNPTYGYEGSKDLDDWIDFDQACQYEPYDWIDEETGKPHTSKLRDKFGHKYSAIPTDNLDAIADSSNAGGWWITMYDSLKTKECKCDSIHTLKLYVKRAFRDSSVMNFCTGGVYDWIVNGEVVRTFDASELGVGHFHDEIIGIGANGCDSSYYVDIYVDSTYLDTVHITLCASDEHFVWHDSVYDSYLADSRNWLDSLALYQRFDTITKMSGCDSTIVLHLTIGPSKDSTWIDTICEGEKYLFFNQELTEPDTYTHTQTNKWGCLVNYELDLRSIPPTKFDVQTDNICMENTGEGETYTIRYIYDGEFAPITYNVRYDSIAHAAGFVDQIDIPITIPEEEHIPGLEQFLDIPTPVLVARENYPRPGHYNATISFTNGVCIDDSLMRYTIDIVMSYPAWLTEQRYGDVIALLNDKYNGGYTFSSYQWYQGEKKLIGQTNPYLYVPTGLVYGDQYHVVLTRQGEKESFPTCPITISLDPRFKDYAPTMGFLDVAPTCVTAGHPYITILSRHGGTYRITTSEGSAVSEGSFHADATEVTVPSVSGMYIVQLWSDATPEEPYRAVKIVVKDRCETCATSF